MVVRSASMGLFEKKKVFSFIEVDDSTPVAALSPLDQLRIVVKQMTEDPEVELSNENFAMSEIIKLKANLQDFLYKATAPIRKGDRNSVIVSIDSQFQPVLKEVLNSDEIQNYYKVRVAKPKVEYDINYDIMVELTVRNN